LSGTLSPPASSARHAPPSHRLRGRWRAATTCSTVPVPLVAETHLPLVGANQQEIGFTKAELTRFDSNLDGSAPALYRQAELYFPSMAALKQGTATPGFKKVADDLANFATGGLDGLIAVETR
jgi:uncharacterized protein (TIGR02118 family)